MLQVIVLLGALNTPGSECTLDHNLMILEGGQTALPSACLMEGDKVYNSSKLKPSDGQFYPKFMCPHIPE